MHHKHLRNEDHCIVRGDNAQQLQYSIAAHCLTTLLTPIFIKNYTLWFLFSFWHLFPLRRKPSSSGFTQLCNVSRARPIACHCAFDREFECNGQNACAKIPCKPLENTACKKSGDFDTLKWYHKHGARTEAAMRADHANYMWFDLSFENHLLSSFLSNITR